ncbi:MAG: BMP family ABC transporter substrate-binding protein [Candidatus Acetothermia bacterium]|jgi:basic membrane lipoprotein Med (substrate-binding protein (PBP1-ABC) superfamily)|nr:BMP family ABC transporter substrate-binding protein [Candidatus Acetothermia bacterium]
MKRALVAMLAVAVVGLGALAEPCLTVGMIIGGTKDDAGYNQSQYDALMALKEEMPCVQILFAENVPEGEAEAVLENMILQGAKLLFPAGFGYMFPALNLAKRYPDVQFMHPGGYMLAPNFGTYFSNVQFAYYVLGVAAGLMTQTNKLGFIGGMPNAYVLGNCNAFHLGARAVNPGVTTVFVVTGAWLDRAKEVAATQALLQQGCDVIGSHLDSPIAVAQTVEAAGKFFVGYPSLAVQQFAPTAWITGLGLTWGDFFVEVAQQVLAGEFVSGHIRRGLEAGFLTLGEFGPRVPEDVKQTVLQYKENLVSGELQPFAGPIKDQTGEIKIPEGTAWGPLDMGKFDWLAEGIVGSPK